MQGFSWISKTGEMLDASVGDPTATGADGDFDSRTRRVGCCAGTISGDYGAGRSSDFLGKNGWWLVGFNQRLLRRHGHVDDGAGW